MKLICYNHSRNFGPYTIPISIQSIYLKNYCNANNINFSLPVTEYCVEQNYFALIQSISSVKSHERNDINILTSSAYIFEEAHIKTSVYKLLIENNIMINCVLENIKGDIQMIQSSIYEMKIVNELSSSWKSLL